MQEFGDGIKNLFPVLSKKFGDKTITYLDSTATTQKPVEVIQSMTDFYTNDYSSVKRGVYQLSEKTNQQCEQTRSLIRQLINAPRNEEIIFTRGTTESINIVAACWGRANLNPGDEILISALEHHANIVPWQMIANEKQAILKVIPCDDDANLIMDSLSTLISHKTRIVAVTHISNSTGTINDIQKICVEAKKYNALVLIDAAQSIAHLPIDVQKIGCDFLAFSGHKMYGPTGIGVLWGRYELLAEMPPWQGGGEMILQVSFAKTTYATPPSRFEAGTPAIAEIIGLGAAVRFLNEIGIQAAGTYEHTLLKYAEEQLRTVQGLRIIGNPIQRSSLLSFVLSSAHAHDAAMILDEEAIAVRAGHHCAQPVMERFGVPATVRASFAVYNTKKDIDHLVNVLHRINRIFA
jgi:cysteine desulfurase/selenocysteine lyase